MIDSTDELGPVDYIVVEFPGSKSNGEIAPALGDLTAAGNLGRACAVLEALLGEIYLVTVVAVLVSRIVPRSRGDAPSAEA